MIVVIPAGRQWDAPDGASLHHLGSGRTGPVAVVATCDGSHTAHPAVTAGSRFPVGSVTATVIYADDHRFEVSVTHELVGLDVGFDADALTARDMREQLVEAVAACDRLLAALGSAAETSYSAMFAIASDSRGPDACWEVTAYAHVAASLAYLTRTSSPSVDVLAEMAARFGWVRDHPWSEPAALRQPLRDLIDALSDAGDPDAARSAVAEYLSATLAGSYAPQAHMSPGPHLPSPPFDTAPAAGVVGTGEMTVGTHAAGSSDVDVLAVRFLPLPSPTDAMVAVFTVTGAATDAPFVLAVRDEITGALVWAAPLDSRHRRDAGTGQVWIDGTVLAPSTVAPASLRSCAVHLGDDPNRVLRWELYAASAAAVERFDRASATARTATDVPTVLADAQLDLVLACE